MYSKFAISFNMKVKKERLETTLKSLSDLSNPIAHNNYKNIINVMIFDPRIGGKSKHMR